MTRTLSAAARASINAENTSEVWLAMVKLSHDDWAQDIRLVNNTEDVTHDGEVYEAFPFSVRMPDETDDGTLPVVQWAAINAKQELTEEFRSTVGPIDGVVFWVLASSPDTIEIGPMELQLRSFEYDSMYLSGAMVIEPVLDAVFGADNMDTVNCPGLF